jgi:hypothetical protein
MFTMNCKVPGCGATALVSEELTAQWLANWHVYEEHREIWIAVIGEDRPPRDPDPRIPISDGP